MSVRVMNLVFEGAKGITGNDRVVLLALADCAHDDGAGAYPSKKVLGEKCGDLAERTVYDCLTRLEKCGAIERVGKRGRSIEYRVLAGVAQAEKPAEPAGENPAASRDETCGLTGGNLRPPAASKEPSGTVKEPTPLPPDPAEQEWREFVGHHERVTGFSGPKRGTADERKQRASYFERRGEGYTAHEIRLASIGAAADEYRREHGYLTVESVLRPTKIGGLIARGKQIAGEPMIAAGSALPPPTAQQLGEWTGARAKLVARLESANHHAAAETVSASALLGLRGRTMVVGWTGGGSSLELAQRRYGPFLLGLLPSADELEFVRHEPDQRASA